MGFRGDGGRGQELSQSPLGFQKAPIKGDFEGLAVFARDPDALRSGRGDGADLPEGLADRRGALDDGQADWGVGVEFAAGRDAVGGQAILARDVDAIAEVRADLLETEAAEVALFPWVARAPPCLMFCSRTSRSFFSSDDLLDFSSIVSAVFTSEDTLSFFSSLV